MAISTDEIKALARLAKLEFDDERCETFKEEFNEIIEFAGKINGAIVGNSSDIREIVGEETQYAELREDEERESLPPEKITSGAEAQSGYFTVRRVVK